MISRKQTLLFLPALAAVTAAGWWLGAAEATARRAGTPGPGGHSSAVALPNLTDAAPDSAALSAAPRPASSVSPAEELRGLMGTIQKMEDPSAGNGKMMIMIWSMGRAVCLMSQLSPEEKTAFLASLPPDQAQEISMTLLGLGAMIGGGKDKTIEELKQELAASGERDEEKAFLATITWAAKDPQALLDFWREEASKENPPPWTTESMGMLFGQIAQADPRLALSGALGVSNEKIRQDALRHVRLGGLFSGDKGNWPADASELVRKQLSAVAADDRMGALRGALLTRLRRETPEESMAWIESLGLGPDSKAWTENALAGAWREHRPAEAGDWVLSRTPAAEKAAAVEDMVKWWTLANLTPEERLQRGEPDIAACADWILSLGIGPDTEKGISRLAEAWIDSGEPAAAIEWARAIPNPEAREASLTHVTTQIRRRYPDTWRAMLSAAGLAGAEAAPAADGE